MLGLTAATHIYLYRAACDLRKSFDGLCGVVRSELDADPLSGYLFVFLNRRRTMVKLLKFLEDYRGYVHTDAYSGYDELFRREGIIEVGCWVHARRKSDEATSSRPKEATEVLAWIAQLYKIEAECSEMSLTERYKVWEQGSRAILDGIFQRLQEMKAAILPSEPLSKAIDYTLNQRTAL